MHWTRSLFSVFNALKRQAKIYPLIFFTVRLPLRGINNDDAVKTEIASVRGETKAVVRIRVERTIAREQKNRLVMPPGKVTGHQAVMSEVVLFLVVIGRQFMCVVWIRC